MSIYKPSEICGHADRQLSPALFETWGRVLGGQVDRGEKFVIGGDVRASTPTFLDALSEGLCRAGADVVDLGIRPVPMIHYAKRRLQAAACAVVTASHRPAEMNGLKWMVGEHPPDEDQVETLRLAVDQPKRLRAPRKTGKRRSLDVSFDYVAWLQETWFDSMHACRRVVLDPMHGCLSQGARRYLQAVFPHCLFLAIHDEPDPSLANRCPDCSRPELLHELSSAVYRERADLGIAFDGDGDRVAFVDEEGMPLTAEEATCILLESFGDAAFGESFVHDLMFSQRLPDRAKQLGAKPLRERSGHAFLRRRMLRSKAVFGACTSGHYFFRALGGGDDGLFTACWLIAWLDHVGSSLGELRRQCPPMFVTPDLRVPADPRLQQSVLRKVRQAWSDYPQTSLDGVRIEFPDGWALVRRCRSEPGLVFRFEADGWLELRQLVWSFCEVLDEVGDQVWMKYTAALGSGGALEA